MIKEIKTHEEKIGNKFTGRVHLYCSNFLCGIAIPQRNNTGCFRFSSNNEIIQLESRTNFTLEEIKFQIQLSLIEFTSKVTLKPKANNEPAKKS